MADWLIHANPQVWDVFAWWENEDEALDSWTLSWPAPEVSRSDRFALWIGGKEAGVYATGTIASSVAPTRRPSGGYWKQPPQGKVYGVALDTELYLFDSPIRKSVLAADLRFTDALILRMPRARNPIRLTPPQWAAIAGHLPTGIKRTYARARPSSKAGESVVTERAIGAATEITTVSTVGSERTRIHREARLVKDYERHVGRHLVIRSVRLPQGDRLVVDAYDPVNRVLIEAKASATRTDVRMAIGQLLDYRRHIDPKADLAILLPERPNDDLVALLGSLKITIVYKHGRKFQTI